MRLRLLISLIALALAGCATLPADTRATHDDLSARELAGFDSPRCAGTAEAGGCPPWQDWPR